MENIFWFIFLIPYISFLIISLVIRPFFNDRPKWSGYLTILAVAASLAVQKLGTATLSPDDLLKEAT